jgi:DNA-directed RNA polymerase specialized sigma24 family protein
LDAIAKLAPKDALEVVGKLRLMQSSLEREYVRQAREAGLTWEEVGALLGVSTAAVHKRFADSDRAVFRRHSGYRLDGKYLRGLSESDAARATRISAETKKSTIVENE